MQIEGICKWQIKCYWKYERKIEIIVEKREKWWLTAFSFLPTVFLKPFFSHGV